MTEEIKSNTEEAVAPEVVTEPTAVATTADSNSRMMNMMIGVVGVLVIMAGIQVFQTQQLMAAVSSGSIKTGAPAQQQQGSGIGVQSQVGGCG